MDDVVSDSKSIVDLDSGNQVNGGSGSFHDGDCSNSDLMVNCSNTKVEDEEESRITENNVIVNPNSNLNPSVVSKSKGYGLKKWRRIRRNDQISPLSPPIINHVIGNDKDKDTDNDKDYDSDSTARMLKRGSPDNDNGGSVRCNLPTFNVGSASAADSDDRSSSKSSTAATATAPNLKPSSSHLHPRDKHKHKHKHNHKINNSNHNPKSPSPDPDSIKKPRGEIEVEVERERDNSPLSSMDSGSINSNTVFLQTPNHPLTFDSNSHSDSVPMPPPSSTSTNLPPQFLDSIIMLQSAQLALQTEVQKFAEIGKGISSLCDDSDKTSVSFDPVVVDYKDHSSDGLNDFNHAYYTKIVQRLQTQLNEVQTSLKEKEKQLEVVQLQTTLEPLQHQAQISVLQECERCQAMEAELQDLFKQKLEAEVQSVVLTRSTEVSRVLVEKMLNLTREQTQTQSHVENKAVDPLGQAELDRHNARVIDDEETLSTKRGVMKYTKFLFIQLALLVVVVALFVLQLGPKSAVVVPT